VKRFAKSLSLFLFIFLGLHFIPHLHISTQHDTHYSSLILPFSHIVLQRVGFLCTGVQVIVQTLSHLYRLNIKHFVHCYTEKTASLHNIIIIHFTHLLDIFSSLRCCKYMVQAVCKADPVCGM